MKRRGAAWNVLWARLVNLCKSPFLYLLVYRIFLKIGELYNPKLVRQLTINANGGGQNGQSHQRTLSDKIKDPMSTKNGEVAANVNNANLPLKTSASLVVAVSTMSLGENGVEPSPSISTFQVGIEQEPTVATTSST